MINISFLNLKVIKENCGRYDIQRKINSPSDFYNVALKVLELDERAEESLFMATLDTKNNITGIFEVSRGSLNSSIVHPREVFKRAVMQNAASIILYHNHPSGDPTPSQDDIDTTKRIVESGEILGIALLDHLIIGENKYISLKEKGII